MGSLNMPAAGQAAPPAELLTLDGNPFHLAAELAAGPILLAFFKVTCPTCQLALPFFNRLAAAGNLRVFGVSQNPAPETAKFAEYFRLSYPMLLDPDLHYRASNDYGLTHVPSCFLIEPDGAVGWTMEGFVKRDFEDLGLRFGIQTFFSNSDDVPAWKPG